MNYIKIGISTLFVTFLAFAVFISPAFAIEVSDNGTTAMSNAPATVNNGNTSVPSLIDNGNTSAPDTVSNGNTASSNAPATQDNGNTSGSIVPATVNNGNTSGNLLTPQVGNVSGGGLYKSGGTSLPILTNISGCAYITTYMKSGNNNVTAEVTKLQSFLKNTEGLTVDINGTFDQKTFEAVKAFQTKYMSDILTPWGISTPTGSVYFTTQKKVNELYCKSTFSLTTEHLAIITAYKKGLNTQGENIVDLGNSSSTTATSTNVGLNTDNNNSQTASVGGAASATGHLFVGIWNWVKWLFGVSKK